MPAQSGWRWCSKCEGLFFSGNATYGACPAGGAHTDYRSGEYTLTHAEVIPGRDNGWRWCKNCEGLFYGRDNTGGVCPAGGCHTAGGGSYTLLPRGGGGQADWYQCAKCAGLFFAGHTKLGNCPAVDGGHRRSDRTNAIQMAPRRRWVVAVFIAPMYQSHYHEFIAADEAAAYAYAAKFMMDNNGISFQVSEYFD